MLRHVLSAQSGHDFTPAAEYGELVYITKGLVPRYKTNTIYRQVAEALSEAHEEDYLVISSLAIISSLASAFLARRFGKVNYLLFRDGRYVERVVDIDSLTP